MQIDEDEIGIVGDDALGEARAVAQFDRVDAGVAQRFGEALQKAEVAIHHEAEGRTRSAVRHRGEILQEYVAHCHPETLWFRTGARASFLEDRPFHSG